MNWILVTINEFIFRIISQNGCGEGFEGVAVAAQMFHVDQVRAFIGPYCSTGKSILNIVI